MVPAATERFLPGSVEAGFPDLCGAREMNKTKRVLALALALPLVSGSPGCAVYHTYEKCGFSGCPGDATITANVRALFDRHPALQPPNLLSVQTLDHVVYLSGVVDTDLERQMAQSVALEAPGVVRVVNSIGVSNNR
jgi:osmotically-inducible protein OsmY